MDEQSWLWFTAKFPQDIAVGIFVKKHGVQPKTVKVEGDYLKLGPEPEPEWKRANEVQRILQAG